MLSTSSTKIYITQEDRSYSGTQNKLWKEFIERLRECFEVKFISLEEQHENYSCPEIHLLKLKKL